MCRPRKVTTRSDVSCMLYIVVSVGECFVCMCMCVHTLSGLSNIIDSATPKLTVSIGCVSLFPMCEYSSEQPWSPHRVCMSGAQATLWRGPWGRCGSAEGSPCGVLMSACVVCRLERFARYLGRREGGGQGLETGSSAGQLCPHWLTRVGENRKCPPPFPTFLPMGVIFHTIFSQSEKSESHKWRGL